MIKVLPKDPGPCRVAHAGEVKSLCLAGYQVVAMYTEQNMEAVSKDVIHPNTGITQTVMESMLITNTMFLMSQSEEGALADLQGRLDLKELDTEHLKSEHKEEVLIYVKQEAKIQDALRGKERQIKRLQTDLGAALGASESLTAKCDDLTRDTKTYQDHQDQLQRLWVELGSAKMRGVLGLDAKAPRPLSEPKTAHERVADDHHPDLADDIPF
jgi:hypothetical protein